MYLLILKKNMFAREVNQIQLIQCRGIIYSYLLTYLHLILLNFRQRSIDSEKNILPLPVIEQAKLIEVEKAETGSVRMYN